MLFHIDELINQFKQYGGKFDNAEVRYSSGPGFHCYSENSNNESLISCPAHLLVAVEDIGINEDGLYICNPDKYAEYICFLNQYFKLQFNEQTIKYESKRKRQIQALTKDELSLISRIVHPNMLSLEGYEGLAYERKRIIEKHNIVHFGKNVIMPFLTLVNHDKNGARFDIQKDSISVRGKYSGEITVKYDNDLDVLKIASGYDFITDSQYILSIPLGFTLNNGKLLVIEKNTRNSVQISVDRWKPVTEVLPDKIIVSWFPLYLHDSPMYPATIAKMIADEIGMPAENLLYSIIRFNLHALVPAAFQLSQSQNEFAKHIGAAAQRQLETIAATR